jgi:hypothetical protein
MKKSLLAIFSIIVTVAVSAQSTSYSYGMFRDRLELNGSWTPNLGNGNFVLINNERVAGSPFLFEEWADGYVKTPDGREYNQYRFKYNPYDGSVHFKNGNDSVEIDEKIGEFALTVTDPDDKQVKKLLFLPVANYPKVKNIKGYYQVVYDGALISVLKAYRKEIKTTSSALPGTADNKFFDTYWDYYYYDKTSKKITLVKGDFTALTPFLPLNDEEKNSFMLQIKDKPTENLLSQLLRQRKL